MRVTSELRTYLVDNLLRGFSNPAMFGGTSEGVELAFTITLDHLLFLDERPVSVRDILLTREHFSSAGVYGRLRELMPERDNLCSEIASVFAEVFVDCGYCEKAVRMHKDRWLRMAQELSTRKDLSDLTADASMSSFGPPTFVISPGGFQRVHCYASDASQGAWFFMDFLCDDCLRRDRYMLLDIRYPQSFEGGRIRKAQGPEGCPIPAISGVSKMNGESSFRGRSRLRERSKS